MVKKSKWIHEFLRLYSELTLMRTGRRQDASAVENEVARYRSKTQICSEQLHAIEESTSWDYPNWWNKLSPSLDPPVDLPPDPAITDGKQFLVAQLYDRLKHIEVVSVLLRFVFPDEFGILSPPVASLLGLPYEEDHIEYYLRYVSVLGDFRMHYEGLRRVADVDMALWSAAHGLPDYRALVDEMHEDAYFQQVRLTNLLEGLGRHWTRGNRNRMLLARSLLKTDYEVAGALTSVVYEPLVNEIADEVGVSRQVDRHGNPLTGNRVKMLSERARIDGLSVRPKELWDLWQLRNRAVHCKPPLTQQEATEFVRKVHDLLQGVQEWKAKQRGKGHP